MKRILLSILLGLPLSFPIYAEEIISPHISVYGTATTDVIPNEMIWALRVETKGPQLDAVAADHSKTVAGVLAFLKDAGINAKAIQASRMSFGEDWDDEGNKRTLKGYVASTSVAFKLSDFTAYQKLWTGLAKIPGISIESVTYDHTGRATLQNEARQKALLIAREKARSLALVVGSQVGDPLVIEEEQAPDEDTNAGMAPARVMTPPVPPAEISSRDVLAPGTIPIRVTVHATFKLEPKPK